MQRPYEKHLAPFATRSVDSVSRQHPQPKDPLRSPFELDRHRIVESAAFRRLEGKTQVFAPAHGDHFRTRLTHTLEATLIARCLAVSLEVHETLAEVIVLAHDLGHPPFGHAGETALDQAMTARGGFNHNAHSLRVVEYLEHPFPAFRGLNLTTATLAGLRSHETAYDTPAPSGDASDSPDRNDRPSVEAQIASVADRLAYNMHDLEDAIGAGFVKSKELGGVALWRGAYQSTKSSPADHLYAIRRVVLDDMLDTLLTDVIEESQKRLSSPSSTNEAHSPAATVVALSQEMAAKLTELERFMFEKVYRHPEVAAVDASGREMVLALFESYRSNPTALPDRFANRISEQGVDRVICDYIAGMTDKFCAEAHETLR